MRHSDAGDPCPHPDCPGELDDDTNDSDLPRDGLAGCTSALRCDTCGTLVDASDGFQP